MKKLALLLTIAAFCSTPVYRAPVVQAGVTAPAADDAKPDPEKIEPAAVELAQRAEAGDTAFIAKLMEKNASPDAAADMIAHQTRRRTQDIPRPPGRPRARISPLELPRPLPLPGGASEGPSRQVGGRTALALPLSSRSHPPIPLRPSS